MIKISERLKSISEFIEDNTNILDIGCDHGLLDIYLMQNTKVKELNNQIMLKELTYLS